MAHRATDLCRWWMEDASVNHITMKSIRLFFLLFIFTQQAFGQAPGAFSYQAVARDDNGTIISNESIVLDIEIVRDAPDGDSVYKESFSLTTTSTGLISVSVGTGSVLSGNFDSINWASGNYFLRTFINGTEMGTTQILSVPYALYANAAETVRTESQVLSLEGNVLSISGGNSIELPIETTKQSILISGNVTNEEVADQLDRELGPNTSVIEINSTTGLTTLDIAGKSELFELKILNNSDLATLSINGLQSVGRCIVEGNNSLDSISVNGLLTCDEFKLSNSAVTSFELPGLHTANVYFGFYNNENAHTLVLPDLEVSNAFAVIGNTILDSININSLQFVKEIIFVNNYALSFVNIDAVLTGFRLSAVLNDFPVTMVDYFLERLVSLPDAEDKDVSITDSPPVPPSTQGLADVAILESRGYHVSVDQ